MPNDAYLAMVIDKIDEHGHMVQGVLADPPFCYTVGLTAKDGQPELVLVGLSVEQGGMILNTVNERLSTGEYPEVGVPFEAGFSVPFMLRGPVDPIEAQANYATYLYNEITLMQVLWPDNEGRFPGDPAYDQADFTQPLLTLAIPQEN